MLNASHKKKTYYAQCFQWDGSNTELVVETLNSHGCEASPYDGKLMLRWRDDWHKPSIEMMHFGDWLRIGENGQLKIMRQPEFDMKYERI